MSPPRRVSIILADDHPVVLHRLASILRAEADLDIVALCDNGTSAAQAIRRHVPELAVLDIGMPGMNGIDVLADVVADGLTTKVVLLTAAATDGQILSAISCGAKGIMLKDMAVDSLVRCIRQVAAGQEWFPTDLLEAGRGREMGHQAQKERLRTLTDRERQVVLSLCHRTLEQADRSRTECHRRDGENSSPQHFRETRREQSDRPHGVGDRASRRTKGLTCVFHRSLSWYAQSRPSPNIAIPFLTFAKAQISCLPIIP